MNNILPKNFNCSDELKTHIEKKLAELKIAEDLFSLVYIVHDVRDFSVVYMSEKGLQNLGKDIDFVRSLGYEYFSYFFNPEDAEFYVSNFKNYIEDDDNRERWFSFFQEVKKKNSESFEWYLSVSKPFVYDENNKPLLSLTFAMLLKEDHHLTEKAHRLKEENIMLLKKQNQFLSLTKKEKEILKYIALGNSSLEISQFNHSSEKTINTHRKNIKRKIEAKSNYDIVRFAQAFNLI